MQSAGQRRGLFLCMEFSAEAAYHGGGGAAVVSRWAPGIDTRNNAARFEAGGVFAEMALAQKGGSQVSWWVWGSVSASLPRSW